MSVLKKKLIKGFTLIELMIVVAIIGILAAVAIPKFADLVTKSKEAALKGTLGSLRSAVSIYYGDTEGTYPANLFNALADGTKYLPALSNAPSLGKYTLPKPSSVANAGHTGGFWDNASGVTAWTTAINDGAIAPIYYNTTGGDTYVNCSHADSKGSVWSTY